MNRAVLVVSVLLENETVAGTRKPVLCAWCQRWWDGSHYVLMPLGTDPKTISHGICPACSAKMWVDMPQPARTVQLQHAPPVFRAIWMRHRR